VKRVFPLGLSVALAAILFAQGSCNGGSLTRPAIISAPRPAAVPARMVPIATPVLAQSADFVLSGALTQGGWIRGIAPAGATRVTLNGDAISLAGDGSFFAAFDRDAGANAILIAAVAGARQITRPLTIAPRAWNIEHIAIGPRPGALPSAEYQRRRPLELAQINAARAINATSDGWRQHFIWPVRGRISGMFGSQRIYRGQPGAYHSGVDVATGASGTPYVAPADGVVILAAQSPFTLEGNLLMIDHGMGLNSAFLHSSQLLVRQGERIRQGQVIGMIGMTGRATGPHLHWSMKWHQARLDPILFTGAM
jgi:murein DD-endopeptidase MepM/ murein hydrolase activator NlpD